MLTITRTQAGVGEWPDDPYKGLSFYEPDDAPLFAGRDSDVVECAELLASSDTRVLILHGSTGCGKSSFLRAGLIPFLEDEQMGFGFLKEGEKLKSVFVRSTARPLAELAKQVYDFATGDVEIKKAEGVSRKLGLPEVVARRGRDEFAEEAGRDPAFLIKVLGDLAARLPRTLVLIIDQAEEVLTLKPEGDDDPARNFFYFLDEFSRTQCDLKLLVALRTEFYGKFRGKMARGTTSSPNVIEYLLDDLTKEQIVRAIERPTSGAPVGNLTAPQEKYRFTFEPGLAEKIAGDLLSKNLAGGLLPVLQVVCDTLYHATKGAPDGQPRVITATDYGKLGSIEDQVDKHVTETLTRWCESASLTGREAQREIDRWKEVLATLASAQADGTVTTGVINRARLYELVVEERGSRLNFDETVKYLVQDKVRVLRPAGSTLTPEGEPASFSLGHDAIGLALHRWKLAKQESEEAMASTRRSIYIMGFSLIGISILLAVGGVVFSNPDAASGLLGGAFGTAFWGLVIVALTYASKYGGLDRLFYSFLALYPYLIPQKRWPQIMKDKKFLAALQRHPRAAERMQKLLEKRRKG